MDQPVADLHDLLVVADSGSAHPAGHGSGAPSEARVPEGLGLDVQHVYYQHLSWPGAVDVDSPAGRIAANELCLKLLLVGMALDPRTAIHLRNDLELFSGIDEERGRVIRPGLEVEDVFCGSLHFWASRNALAPSMNRLDARAEDITSSAICLPAA